MISKIIQFPGLTTIILAERLLPGRAVAGWGEWLREQGEKEFMRGYTVARPDKEFAGNQ